jgi:hypothetical protein
LVQVVSVCVLCCSSCSEPEIDFDPADPARGPGQLAGQPDERRGSSAEDFAAAVSDTPQTRSVTPPEGSELPDCGADCQSHCDGLALQNPVDDGACRGLWGVGLRTRPIVAEEACRRLWVDLTGRFPTRDEVEADCMDRDYAQVAAELMATPEFVLVNQRRWADRLLYNNQAVSIERIYDMDALVGKIYRGEVAYDEFAAVLSAHPVITRRYDTAGDRAEAVFTLLLGRPPYENERADMARLYALWRNGYYDHPKLQQRLPDATIEFRCVDDQGRVDVETKGECTSIRWGYNELILEPDFRARDGEMWSGLLTADEWERLQLPGRILSAEVGFWEHAVDRVLQLYLGYDLGTRLPDVRQALIEYVLAHDGDIRAAHHAVVTSQLYLQTSTGATDTTHRFTYGPLKQVDVEPWIDTVEHTTGYSLSRCDHRLPDPEALMNGSFTGYAVVNGSRWELDEDNDVVDDYRGLARTLGGCPENEVGGRFKTVSILTTATQEGFVTRVCNPTLEPEEGAPIERLLPDGMDPDRALDADVAESIYRHQLGRFFARGPADAELDEVREAADACAPKPCTAEMFARPTCYALLSSSEMLFY